LHHEASGQRRGHRIRVNFSTGAHPTYARNLGTGEPILTGSNIAVADQTLHLELPTDSCVKLWEYAAQPK
jgi:uncharacterized protein